MEFMNDFEQAEIIDKLKNKIMKYVLYKKRSEYEVRQKFYEEDANLLEDIIENLKENGYINDTSYIERSINEFINLKHLSIKEIIYKLTQKGIKKFLIEQYVCDNKEELIQYEIKSAKHIWNKKILISDEQSVKEFLYKKGYMQETVKYISEL